MKFIVYEVGLVINFFLFYLGVLLDGKVFDFIDKELFGFLEIKVFFVWRNSIFFEVC